MPINPGPGNNVIDQGNVLKVWWSHSTMTVEWVSNSCCHGKQTAGATLYGGKYLAYIVWAFQYLHHWVALNRKVCFKLLLGFFLANIVELCWLANIFASFLSVLISRAFVFHNAISGACACFRLSVFFLMKNEKCDLKLAFFGIFSFEYLVYVHCWGRFSFILNKPGFFDLFFLSIIFRSSIFRQ